MTRDCVDKFGATCRRKCRHALPSNIFGVRCVLLLCKQKGRPMTLDEVGQAMGVTRERVRQIEASAMLKLAGRVADTRKQREYVAAARAAERERREKARLAREARKAAKAAQSEAGVQP